MKIEHYDVLTIPEALFEKMSAEMRDAYESFMSAHWRFLKEHCPNRSDQITDIHHVLFAIEVSSNQVIGYRYFYFPIDSIFCELFNIFIEKKYRRKSYATELIKESIRLSMNAGVNKFVVRMAGKSDEREALVKKYEVIAKEFSPPCIFKIYYNGKIYNYS